MKSVAALVLVALVVSSGMENLSIKQTQICEVPMDL